MNFLRRAFVVLVLTCLTSGHVHARRGILYRLFRGRQTCEVPRCCLQRERNCIPPIVGHCVPHVEPSVVFEGHCIPHVEPALKGPTPEPKEDTSVDFAVLAEQLEAAKTITMTVTPYMSFSTKDESRSWIQATGRSELAFRAPHSFRDTRFRRGEPILVQIVDAELKASLTLQVPAKKAIKMDSTINVYGTAESNPLAALGRMFAKKPPEFVEKRQIKGRAVDVYRYIRKPRNTTLDVWIDSQSGSLFAISDPGSDQLDLSQLIRAADAPARKDRGRGRMAGFIRSNIQIDKPLDDELFTLEIPEGYELQERPALSTGPIILQ